MSLFDTFKQNALLESISHFFWVKLKFQYVTEDVTYRLSTTGVLKFLLRIDQALLLGLQIFGVHGNKGGMKMILLVGGSKMIR